MSTSFHNTIGLSGKDLLKAANAAKSQEEKIKLLFNTGQIKLATPADVHRKLTELGFHYPLTSIRRAMSNLTPEFLTKTLAQKQGIYGKPNFIWKKS